MDAIRGVAVFVVGNEILVGNFIKQGISTAIKAHPLHPDPKGLKGMGLEHAPKGSYQLLIEWESGEMTWENYQLITADDPVTIAMYARRNRWLDTQGWRQCKRIIKNGKTLACMENQAKLQSHRNRPKY